MTYIPKPQACATTGCKMKRGLNYKWCPACAKRVMKNQQVLSRKQRNEKSEFLVDRRIKAFCPKCEGSHEIIVRVQEHVKLPDKWRAFCDSCGNTAERDYTPNDCPVGYDGR
jgi:hypothetical protein